MKLSRKVGLFTRFSSIPTNNFPAWFVFGLPSSSIFPARVGPKEVAVVPVASGLGESFGDDFGEADGAGDAMAILVFLGCDAFEIKVCCWEIR